MKRRFLITSIVLALVAGIGVGLYLWLTPAADVEFTAPAPHRVIEMHPDTTPIWAERHHVTADGKKTKTDVLYRNGDTGTRFYRENQTVAKEITRFADGRQRFYAEYAADGKQIIAGSEIRADGTTVWTAERDARTNIVTTTRYWYNSVVFSIERRKVGDANVKRTFYYRSGAKWMHFEGVHDGSLLPDVEEIWRQDGSLVFRHIKGLNETSTDFVYRADGTLHFKQVHVMRPYSYYYPGMTPQPPQMRRMLLKIEVYDATGARAVRDYVMDAAGWYLERVVDHNADGTHTHWSTVYDGTAFEKTIVDKDSRTISKQSLSGRDKPKFKVDEGMQGNYLQQLDPMKVWQELEADPAKR